jgi:hypothetical protein
MVTVCGFTVNEEPRPKTELAFANLEYSKSSGNRFRYGAVPDAITLKSAEVRRRANVCDAAFKA